MLFSHLGTLPPSNNPEAPAFNLVVASFVWVAFVCGVVALAWEASPGLLIPLGIAGLPLLTRTHPWVTRTRWTAVALLGLINVIGGATIGWFLIPATVLLCVAAARASNVPLR